MPSSTAVTPRRKKRGGRGTLQRGWWKRLWPLAAGIAITPVAVRAASIVALEGPKAFALLYPWVVVLRSSALHFPADLVGRSSEWMMFLQFPLYGLVMTLTFRADRHLRAFIVGLILHFTGLFVVVLLAWLAQPAQ